MANKQEKDILIDPRFEFPRGIIGVEYSKPREEEEFSQTSYSLEMLDDETINGEPVGSDSDQPSSAPPSFSLKAPSSFSVVEQKVRISPGGTTVVDVVIEIDDIEGVKEYDTRTTKLNVN